MTEGRSRLGAAPLRGRGRPPGPAVDPETRREQLLDAAESEINSLGAEFALAGVAGRAGLTRSAVYAAFADRDDLLDRLTVRHADRIIAAISRVLAEVAEPRAQTRATIDTLAEWMERNRRLALVLAPRMQAGVGDSRVTEFLQRVLEAGFAQRGGDARAAAPWARALVGATWAAVSWWSRAETMGRVELVDHVTDLVWNGFSGSGGAAVRVDGETAQNLSSTALDVPE